MRTKNKTKHIKHNYSHLIRYVNALKAKINKYYVNSETNKIGSKWCPTRFNITFMHPNGPDLGSTLLKILVHEALWKQLMKNARVQVN